MTCDDCIRYPACVFHLTGHENEKCPNFLNKANLVEVVRCKDCKHLMFSDCYGECSRAYLGIVSPNDYCSHGERKEQK
jgi:hypothetical protein